MRRTAHPRREIRSRRARWGATTHDLARGFSRRDVRRVAGDVDDGDDGASSASPCARFDVYAWRSSGGTRHPEMAKRFDPSPSFAHRRRRRRRGWRLDEEESLFDRGGGGQVPRAAPVRRGHVRHDERRQGLRGRTRPQAGGPPAAANKVELRGWKWIKIRASARTEIRVPTERGKPLDSYLQLPPEEYALLDPRFVTRTSRETFTFAVPLQSTMRAETYSGPAVILRDLTPSIDFTTGVDVARQVVTLSGTGASLGQEDLDRRFELNLENVLSWEAVFDGGGEADFTDRDDVRVGVVVMEEKNDEDGDEGGGGRGRGLAGTGRGRRTSLQSYRGVCGRFGRESRRRGGTSRGGASGVGSELRCGAPYACAGAEAAVPGAVVRARRSVFGHSGSGDAGAAAQVRGVSGGGLREMGEWGG